MKSHGKKMFPGTNSSNIFFIDKQKNNKINPNKYINKTNSNIDKKIINNKLIKESLNNKDVVSIKLPVKKRVLKKYNSTALKKGDINPFSKQNNVIKKRQLVSHRSVDYLKIKKNPAIISLTEPSYSETSSKIYLKHVDLNKVKVKHRILGSNKLNSSFNSKITPKNSKSTFSSFTARKNKPIESKRKVQSKNFLNKFINKNNLLNGKKTTGTSKIPKTEKANKFNKYKIPKEETFIIKKEKLDNTIIDINSLKKNILKNGINFVSITGMSSSLDPINNDSVKLVLNSSDIDSNKFHKIERILKSKGLKCNELKNNYNKKFSGGIFPAHSKWNDGKYGGRENKEKLELSMEFQKKKKENKFHKKSVISKQNFYDITYKNTQIKRNKSTE